MNQNELAIPIGSMLQEYKIKSILDVGGLGINLSSYRYKSGQVCSYQRVYA